MTTIDQCPCRSGVPSSACCGPLLSGQKQALTAVALMRSRYTAYATGDVAYVLRTWHPSTRPSGLDPADIPEWCDLKIIRTGLGGAEDEEGIVEFAATARMRNTTYTLRETSRFVKESGQWLYVGGENETMETNIGKTGRNAPCPCGSGKKFKKCCGR